MKLEELATDERKLLEDIAATCQRFMMLSENILKEQHNAVQLYSDQLDVFFETPKAERGARPAFSRDYLYGRHLTEDDVKEIANFMNSAGYVPFRIYGIITGNLQQKMSILGHILEDPAPFDYESMSKQLNDLFRTDVQEDVFCMGHINAHVTRVGAILRGMNPATAKDSDEQNRIIDLQTRILPEFEALNTRIGELSAEWQALHSPQTNFVAALDAKTSATHGVIR